ncbi:MAG: hypothetical protein NZ898_10945 [Myxococcota bacterium]|nr:hypothetical protein [Myxococcota bacterium]MDW8364052.1 glutaredoxin domain-containing protein [Myxococcales bacterium]
MRPERRDVARSGWLVGALVAVAQLGGCGSSDATEPAVGSAQARAPQGEREGPDTPPFDVRDGVEGLLFVWFDARGIHTTERLEEVPASARAAVRVDSLRLPPERRLDPEHVWVADLRAAGPDGRYPVRRVPRERFDAMVRAARASAAVAGSAVPPAVSAPDTAGQGRDADVILYVTSWCGVCRAAAAWLRDRGVVFVEKDIERDAAARAEMQRKLEAAGLVSRGVPVLDVRGVILPGFDPEALARALQRTAPAVGDAI